MLFILTKLRCTFVFGKACSSSLSWKSQIYVVWLKVGTSRSTWFAYFDLYYNTSSPSSLISHVKGRCINIMLTTYRGSGIKQGTSSCPPPGEKHHFLKPVVDPILFPICPLTVDTIFSFRKGWVYPCSWSCSALLSKQDIFEILKKERRNHLKLT